LIHMLSPQFTKADRQIFNNLKEREAVIDFLNNRFQLTYNQ